MNPQHKISASLSSPARSRSNRRLPQRQWLCRGGIRALLPLCAVLMFVAQSSRGWAQQPGFASQPAPAPPASLPTNSTGNEAPFLTGLPNAPDVPSSLYTPTTPTYTCSVPECPYFDCDPRIDPFCLPQPGWLADVEVDVNLPHVSNGLHDTVTLGGVTSQVKLGSARLDWTGAPRVELGYRLPDGFGEFDIAYRFLGSRGTGTIEGPGSAPDGPASLVSRLDIQEAELDYASNEISICTWWMKWHFGLRGTDVYFDSRADENPAVAAGGTGIYERRETNNYWGLGPSWALDLERRIGDNSGFTIVGRIDGAIFLGEVEQGFFEVATTGASAQSIRSNPAAVPTANWSLGLAWRPPSCQALRCFIGYQGEGWWDLGAFQGASFGNNAQLYTEGVLFRVDYNY
jgi:hypothetical protein